MRNPFRKRKAQFQPLGVDIFVGGVRLSTPDGTPGVIQGEVETFDRRVRRIVNETLDAQAKDGRRWQ